MLELRWLSWVDTLKWNDNTVGELMSTQYKTMLSEKINNVFLNIELVNYC